MEPLEYGLVPLPIPVPEELEGAVGYDGDARYLALWWEPIGDEAVWCDGRVRSAADWAGYLVYVSHPRVAPHLRPYHLGYSEEPATHYLLIDRVERKAYVGLAEVVERFFREATPRPALPEGVSPEELLEAWREALREAAASFGSLPKERFREEYERWLRRRKEAVDALARALDRPEEGAR